MTLGNTFLYNMNPSREQNSFSNAVESDLFKTYDSVIPALTTLGKATKKFYDLISDTIFEAKNQKGGEWRFTGMIPSSLETVLGKRYQSSICKSGEIDTDSELSQIVSELSSKLIAQEKAEKSHVEILLKRDDEDINAYILPGGKVILTTALVNQIKDQSEDENNFKTKLAAVLGYLIAKASCGHQTKQAGVHCLFALIRKIIKFVTQLIFKEKIQKKSPSSMEKNGKIAAKITANTIDVGGKILLGHQKNLQEKKARQLGLELAKDAGFELNEKQLNQILDEVIQEKANGNSEEIREGIATICSEATKLFV